VLAVCVCKLTYCVCVCVCAWRACGVFDSGPVTVCGVVTVEPVFARERMCVCVCQ